MRVVVISGQSNMVGAPGSTGGLFYINRAVQIYDSYQQRWEVLDLGTYAHYFRDSESAGLWGSIGGGRNNVAGGIGPALYEATGGEQIKIIANGRNGTAIANWIGDGTDSVRYVDLKTDIEEALANLGVSTIDAFIWQHGERDMVLGRTQAEYTADRATLFSQLRAESWFPATTPILCGEPCPEWTSTAALGVLMASLKDLDSDGDDYTARVFSESLVSNDPVDDSIHLSGESLRKLGERYVVGLENFGIGPKRRNIGRLRCVG